MSSQACSQKPPTLVAGSPGEEGLRRTSRVGKQRIMMVDGVPVLKLNNYGLKGGERSVFDQELNRGVHPLADSTTPLGLPPQLTGTVLPAPSHVAFSMQLP